jgi:hypothetical protein
MKNLATSLAITGILQHRKPIVYTPTVVETALGSGTYTGILPTISIVPLPITVVNPALGQGTYTGLAPSTAIIPPFTFTMTTSQPIISSANPDNPWNVTYRLYDSGLILITSYIHNVNKGATPSVDLVTNTYTSPTTQVRYIEVTASRLLESFGPAPKNRRTNTSGAVICYLNGIEYARLSFANNTNNINYTPATQIIATSGQSVSVEIYE